MRVGRIPCLRIRFCPVSLHAPNSVPAARRRLRCNDITSSSFRVGCGNIFRTSRTYLNRTLHRFQENVHIRSKIAHNPSKRAKKTGAPEDAPAVTGILNLFLRAAYAACAGLSVCSCSPFSSLRYGSTMFRLNTPPSALYESAPPYFSASIFIERTPKPWLFLSALCVTGIPSSSSVTAPAT